MRESMIFYRSFYEALEETDDETRLQVYDAIFEYGLNEGEPELEGVSKALFTLMKPQIDANIRRYKNGKKGGRPAKKKQSEAEPTPSISKPKVIQTQAEKEPSKSQSRTKQEPSDNQGVTKAEPKRNQNVTKQEPRDNQDGTKPKPNVNVNVNVNDNANVNANENVKENVNKTPLTPLRGEPPELREVVQEWLAYKKEKRQAYKPTGLKSFVTQVKNNVEEYGADAVITVIRDSMASNYQGVVWDRLKKQPRAAPKDVDPFTGLEYAN